MSRNTPRRSKPLDPEQLLAGRMPHPMEQLADRTAHHELDQAGDVDLPGRARVDALAVAHHRDPIGDLEDLVQAVGDVDDRHAAQGQLAHDAEQPLRFCLGQGGRGLVQDQDPGVVHQGARDLDHLRVRARERADGRVEVESRPEALEGGRSLPAHAVPIESPKACAGTRPADEQIFDDGQVREEVEFLRHHGDAGVLGGAWR